MLTRWIWLWDGFHHFVLYRAGFSLSLGQSIDIVEALEILQLIEEDSDWNDLDEECESSSDDEYNREDETDYLAIA